MSATDRDVSQLSNFDDDNTVRTASSRATSVSSLSRSNARHSRGSCASSNSPARRTEAQAAPKSHRKHRVKKHHRKAIAEAASPPPDIPRGRHSSRASSRSSLRGSNACCRTPVGSRLSSRAASPAASRGSPRRTKRTVHRTVNVTTSAPMRNMMSTRRQEMAAANYWMQEQERRQAAAYGLMPFAYQTVDQYHPFSFGCAMTSSASPPYLPSVLPQHGYAMAPQPYRQGTLALAPLPSPIMGHAILAGHPHSHLVLPTISTYGGLTYGSLPPLALPSRKGRLERRRSASGRRSRLASPNVEDYRRPHQQYRSHVTKKEKSHKRGSSERGELKTTTRKKSSSVQRVIVKARGDTIVTDSSTVLKKKKVRRGSAARARPHSPGSPMSQRSLRSLRHHKSPRSAQRRSATPPVIIPIISNEQASLKAVAVQTKPRTPSPASLRKPPSRQGSPIGVIGRVDASVSPRPSASSTQEGSRSPSSVRFRSPAAAGAAAERRPTPVLRQAAVQTGLATRSPAFGMSSNAAQTQQTALASRTPPLASVSPTVRASAASRPSSGRAAQDQPPLLLGFTKILSTSGNSDILLEVKRYYADLMVDFSSALDEKSRYWKELMLYQAAISWLKIAQLWAYAKLLNGRNDALANILMNSDLNMNPEFYDSLSQLRNRTCGLLTAPFGGFANSRTSIRPPTDLKLVDYHLGVIAVAVVEFVISEPKAAAYAAPSVLQWPQKPPEIWEEITPIEGVQVVDFARQLYDIACECLGLSTASVNETPNIKDRGKWLLYKMYMAVQLALRARVLSTLGKTVRNCTTLSLSSVFTPDLLCDDPLHWLVRDFDKTIRDCFSDGQQVSLDCANVIIPRADVANDLTRLAVNVLRMCKPKEKLPLR